MKIRFTKQIKLSFVTGLDGLGEIKTESKMFHAGDELDCFVEQIAGNIELRPIFGVADNVPADCFQFLSLTS